MSSKQELKKEQDKKNKKKIKLKIKKHDSLSGFVSEKLKSSETYESKEIIKMRVFLIFIAEFFTALFLIPFVLMIIKPGPGINKSNFKILFVIYELPIFINSLVGFVYYYFKLKNIFDYFNVFYFSKNLIPEQFLQYRAQSLNYPIKSSFLYFFRLLAIIGISNLYIWKMKIIMPKFLVIYITIFIFSALNVSLIYYYMNLAIIKPVFKIIKLVKIEAENTPFKIYIVKMRYLVFLTFFLPSILLFLLMIFLFSSIIGYYLTTKTSIIQAVVRYNIKPILSRIALLAIFSITSLSLSFGIYLERYIKDLIKDIDNVEKGDLTTSAEVISTDELSVFAHKLNVTTLTLNRLITKIKSVFNEIINRTKINFDISKKLIQITEEQHTSIRQLRKSISDIDESADVIMEKSRISSEVIKDSLDKLSEEINKFEKSLSNMSEIEEISLKMIESLKLIIDIAAHTKLLALNASIEASRVGEVGKGFSVVAEEIRKLAESSSNVSDQVSSFIELIKDKVKQSLESSSIIKDTIVSIINEVKNINKHVIDILGETEKEVENTDILAGIASKFLSTIEQSTEISSAIEINANLLIESTETLKSYLQAFTTKEKELIITEETVNKIKKEIEKEKYGEEFEEGIEEEIFLPAPEREVDQLKITEEGDKQKRGDIVQKNEKD